MQADFAMLLYYDEQRGIDWEWASLDSAIVKAPKGGYQRSIEFLALTTEIVEDPPRGHAERADQLSRAAESVVRNIAEGAGRWSHQDSGKHYKIARGEAMECAASLDVMRLRKLVTQERYDRGLQLLAAVVAMLTKMT